MKKFLLTAALVLALVTALTAGTMAQYTQTVKTITNDVTAKEFMITTTQTSDSFDKAVEMAPGDSFTYTVKVNNESEVKSDLKLVASVDSPFSGVTYKVEAVSSSDKDLKSIPTSDGHEVTTKEVSADGWQEYKVTVAWDFDTKDALSFQNKTMKLSITASGTQSGTDRQENYSKNIKAA